METTLKYDRVILIKELNDKIKDVGECYEIANVLGGSFLLVNVNTGEALGIVRFEDFDKYFVHEPNFKGWTQWCPLVGVDGQTDVYYRTNRRKVQVKFLTDKVRAESYLNVKDGDEFNLYFGLNLAYLRARNKVMKKKVDKYRVEIIDNEKTIEDMINSLEC